MGEILEQTDLTEEQAAILYDSGWWRNVSKRQACIFQLTQERLCMPFGDFQQWLAEETGHPVFTASLASKQFCAGLLNELRSPDSAVPEPSTPEGT